MQAKNTERALRDLFLALERAGQIDAAAGVYLAASALYLPTTAWHPETRTVIAANTARRAYRA